MSDENHVLSVLTHVIHKCMIAISCQGGTAVSHVATINVEIKSLDDLEAAAKSIGL